MKKLKEMQNERECLNEKADVKFDNVEQKDTIDTEGLNLVELKKKDIGLICENNVLIESSK